MDTPPTHPPDALPDRWRHALAPMLQAGSAAQAGAQALATALPPSLPFAATKIQAPRPRRARLVRPALEAALGQALRHAKVVLLQAPAGYGKTSLLASLPGLLPAGAPLAWVSLDEDDDERRGFSCLTAALEPFDLPWRIAPEALAAQIGTPGGGTRALTELLNALAAAEVEQGVIVLDDLHRVTAPSAFGWLEGLVERLPEQWSVVLASRVQPPLPLARWRVAGELVSFDQEQLAFSAEEAASMAEAEGAGARAAELFDRTRGWPAGLRLLLTAPVRPGGTAGAFDRTVFDFVASEVLDDMPEELHDFLLRVAVLPELTVVRAAAVSGDARAAERFDEIERRGLFATVLDADERTLVLHDLFREALLDRLRRRWPGQEAELLRRAAESEIDPVRRVNFLLRARHWALAEVALAEAAPTLLLSGAMNDLQRLVEAFDDEWRRQSPRLQRLAGMVCILRWDWEAMARHMRGAADAARRRGDRDELDLAEAYLAGALYPLDRNLEGEALIEGLLARETGPDARRLALMADCSQRLRRGELQRLPAMYAEVLDLLERTPDLFAWWECVPPFNWTTVSGMQPLLERYVQGALARIGGRPLPMRADVQLLRVFGRLWQGKLEQAAVEAAGVEADMRWLACSGEAELGLTIYRLIDAAFHGRTEAVTTLLDKLLARETSTNAERLRLWHHHMAIYGLRMADLLAGPERVADIERWAAMLKEDPLRSSASDNHRAVGVRARHAAAQGRFADAAEGFVRLLPLLPSLDVMGQAMEMRLRAAHALLQAGRIDAAAEALVPALERLEAEGAQGQALLAGPAVLQALAEARWAGRVGEPLLAELRLAAELAAQLRGENPTFEPQGDAEGPLSLREREVLERLALGDSNKLIARALDISPHTVKRHVANILDKLELSSRGQAAAWWHENG